MKAKYLLIFPCIAIAFSCGVTKKYVHPTVDDWDTYRDQKKSDTSSIARIPWRNYFRDTILQSLIAEGLKNNYNLKIAIERITSAQAAFQESKSAFLPQVGLNAGFTQSRLAYPQGFNFVKSTPRYDISVNASWEVDIWGKLSSSKRAAYAALLSEDAAKDAVYSQLVSDIASEYYALLVLDRKLSIVLRTAALRHSDVETMTALQHSNVVNGAAVVQSQANEYAAKLAIPILKQQIRQTENSLSVLLGRQPGNISRGNLNGQLSPNLPETGVPAQLLANRPDVKQAELNFRTAFEYTNIARTAFYPSLTLTGASGFSSFSFGDWFTKSTGLFGNIAAGLFQPLYNKGVNKARLKTAKAEQLAAYYNFQQVMLNAGREVSDALYAYQSVEERKEDRSNQILALEKSVDYTQTLLKYNPSTNYIDVLTSEQNLLSAQLDQTNDMLEQWQAMISLYHALGGGWQ